MSRTAVIFALSTIGVVAGGQGMLKHLAPDFPVPSGLSPLHPAGSLTPGTEETVIPLERLGGVWVARVELNDLHQAALIVDTGATFTTISEDLAFDAGITHHANNSPIQLFTAGGNVQAQMGIVNTLRVGNAGRENVHVVIHTIPNLPEGIDGLLGLSFFDRFLVHLDQSARQLRLIPKR